MNNRIESWLYWRDFPDREPETYSRFNELWDECPLCGGIEDIDMGNGHVIDCLCASERWASSIKADLEGLRSDIKEAGFNLEPVSPGGEQLENAIVMAQDFAETPQGILMLSGGYGTGKSHLLSAINGRLFPIALYVTSSDFERNCFFALSSSKLHIYVDAIARAPVLLFDDYGMEYGSEIIESQMIHVVDTRVRRIDFYPLAIATNKTGKQIKHEGRIGSRLMDTQYLTYAKMSNVPDYRTRGV